MAKVRRVALRFPLGGLVRNLGYQDSIPFSTPDCLNVRPAEKTTGRFRGGTRPGLRKDLTLNGTFTALGSGTPVRFIRTMGVAAANQFTHFSDPFNTPPPGNGIEALGWTYLEHGNFEGGGTGSRIIGLFGHPGVSHDGVQFGSAVDPNAANLQGEVSLLSQPVKGEVWAGVARDIGDIDGAQAFSITTSLLMHDNGDGEGRIHRGSYRILAHLSDLQGAATPGDPLEDGFQCSLEFVNATGAAPRTDGYWRVYCRKYVSGAQEALGTANGTFAGGDKDGKFTVQFNDEQVTLFFDGEQLADLDMSAGASIVKSSKVGIGMNAYFTNDGRGPSGVNENDCFTIVDDFLIQYYKTGGNDLETENREIVVASAGGELYREEDIGDLELESDGGSSYATLNDDTPLMVEEQNQLLYIADHRDILADYTDGAIAGSVLTSASVANFESVNGVDLSGTSEKATWAVRLYNVQGTTVEDVYQIASASGGNLTLDRAPGNGTGNGFRIERAPKIYNPSDGTMVIWDVATWASGNYFAYPLERKGFVPDGCHLICTYRRRLVLAGNPPYVFYMSRINDPLDFYIAARTSNPEDLSAATGGTVEGAAGTFLTGVIPFTDDYLLFASTRNLDMLRGDLNLGGEIDNLSHEIGMIGDPGRPSNAYCYGPSGEVVLLGQDGVNIVRPGRFPQSISAIKIPRELFDIDAALFDVHMRYDAKDRGVHIFVTPRGGATNLGGHYWMQWGADSFWPMSFPAAVQPSAIGAKSTSATGFSVVLIGGIDGFVRRFSYASEDDDGTSINSYILVGPFRISGNDVDEGIFAELSAEVSNSGGAVTWSLWVDENPERVTQRAMSGIAADETGTFPTGTTKVAHPNRAGMAAILKLANATGRAWSVERLTAAVIGAGIQRTN